MQIIWLDFKDKVELVVGDNVETFVDFINKVEVGEMRLAAKMIVGRMWQAANS
jgi:hypothetical protein